jgi:hypothetical protein
LARPTRPPAAADDAYCTVWNCAPFGMLAWLTDSVTVAAPAAAAAPSATGSHMADVPVTSDAGVPATLARSPHSRNPSSDSGVDDVGGTMNQSDDVAPTLPATRSATASDGAG